MGIFKDERVLFNNNKNKDYIIHTSNNTYNKNFSNNALDLNIAKRCDINKLYKIIVKDLLIFFGTAFLIGLLGEVILNSTDGYSHNIYVYGAILFIAIITYSIIYYKSFFIRDSLINDYVERKTEFYEILYNKLYEKYRENPEKFNKFREYINIFPKKYKISTAFRLIFGYALIFIVFFGGLLMLPLLDVFIHIDSDMALIYVLCLFAAIAVIFLIFILKPLKLRNDIWYKISLFEKEIVDNIQQIIPNDDTNKKKVNYPLDCKIDIHFMLSVILLFLFNGLYYIIWDYLMVIAEKTYLSKAYLVEDYLAGLIRDRENG